MKKQIMSIAAIAALFATGANAFDTDMNGRLLKQEGTKYLTGKYTWDARNMKATADLNASAAGQLGDALIYPAFFSDKGWESEFTVINTGNEAMVAKVVLYSRDNSKELKDFNIYLSAHDVFRATLKENKLIIKDSSFVYQNAKALTQTNVGYQYTDKPTDASKKNVSEPIPEGAGYIAIYGMIQADDDNTVDHSINGEDITAYHKNHDKLWRDYRHMVDTCRGNWRGVIEDGIFASSANRLSAPDVNLSNATCGQVHSTVRNKTNEFIQFKSPEAQLAGSITLKGNDSRGTRVLTLNATPLLNYTDAGQGLLWTEGEFASIADRRIGAGTANTGNYPKYYGAEILADSGAFNSTSAYKYEYGSTAGNAFVYTQPHKRTLVQLVNDIGASTCRNTADADNNVSTSSIGWSGLRRDKAKHCLITNYGTFNLGANNVAIFNDNEDMKIPDAGGFTFSPATATVEDNIAPGEVTMVANIISDADRAGDFKSGFAAINVTVPGIATQMTATTIGDNTETSWIYSGKLQ